MAFEPRWIALAALLATGACREGVEIAVAQDGSGVTFTPVAQAAKFDACIRSVYVYVYAVATSDEQPVWKAIDGRTRGSCIRALRYGAVPAGFSGKAAPQLRVGQEYRVAVIGAGFNASARFRRQ